MTDEEKIAMVRAAFRGFALGFAAAGDDSEARKIVFMLIASADAPSDVISEAIARGAAEETTALFDLAEKVAKTKAKAQA